MKILILLLLYSPVIFLFSFLILRYQSNQKKARLIFKKFGSAADFDLRYSLDREIINSSFINKWHRVCKGIAINDLVRVNDKVLLGSVVLYLEPYYHSPQDSWHYDLITVLSIDCDTEGITPRVSQTVFANSNVQYWPLDGKLLIIGGFIDDESELACFVKRSEEYLSE